MAGAPFVFVIVFVIGNFKMIVLDVVHAMS